MLRTHPDNFRRTDRHSEACRRSGRTLITRIICPVLNGSDHSVLLAFDSERMLRHASRIDTVAHRSAADRLSQCPFTDAVRQLRVAHAMRSLPHRHAARLRRSDRSPAVIRFNVSHINWRIEMRLSLNFLRNRLIMTLLLSMHFGPLYCPIQHLRIRFPHLLPSVYVFCSIFA